MESRETLINCEFVKQLSVLTESSKEAIEGIEEFSHFKKYMHVERYIEQKLKEIIKESAQSTTKSLILVCGGVGDGKSHVISLLKDNMKDIMSKFNVHNDATESNHTKKNYIEILNEQLIPFNDHNIAIPGEDKLILAINLGTLSNFLDSEDYSQNYKTLKRYVDDRGILDEVRLKETTSDDIFKSISFSNYKMFTLNNQKTESEFITNIFEKVMSNNKENPFYTSYQRNCNSCEYREYCATKMNYEILSNQDIRNSINELLIQCMIEHKTVISVRGLLNYIYEIIVPINSVSIDQRKLDFDELLPNILFSGTDQSSIFRAMSKLDPLNHRSEELDNTIIKLNTSFDIHDAMQVKYIEDKIPSLHKAVSSSINEYKMTNDISILKSFGISYSRMRSLLNSKRLDESRELYNEFVDYLYSYNRNDIKKLEKLYTLVMNATKWWNGKAGDSKVNINLGKKQQKYSISQELSIIPSESVLKNGKVLEQSKLHEFSNEITVFFDIDHCEKYIDIDFQLFKLLNKVVHGYRPNKKDKEAFIQFVRFVNQVNSCGKKNERVYVSELKGKSPRMYRLEKGMFGNYTFGEVK